VGALAVQRLQVAQRDLELGGAFGCPALQQCIELAKIGLLALPFVLAWRERHD
jgi:hypothetical protein